MYSNGTGLTRLFVLCWLLSTPQVGIDDMGPRPLWSSDVLPAEIKDVGRNVPGLAFLENERLAVHYVGLDTEQLSSRTSPTTSSPFRLRVLVLDANSGKMTSSKEWGTRSGDSSVQVTSGGIAIRTGNLLRLCSKELVEVGQVDLPKDPYEGWKLDVSPSGKTLLLNHYRLGRQGILGLSRFEVLDGDTFKSKLSWTESPGLIDHYAITDKVIAAERYENGHGTATSEEFGSAVWRPLFDVSQGTCSPGRSGLFVTDTLLVCTFDRFVMSSSNGEVLMTEPFAKGEGRSAGIAVAQNGSRAAETIENFRDVWDTGGHIVSLRVAVYDLTLKKRIMTVRVTPPPKHNYAFALSPDGSRLAILSDRMLYVYPVLTESRRN